MINRVNITARAALLSSVARLFSFAIAAPAAAQVQQTRAARPKREQRRPDRNRHHRSEAREKILDIPQSVTVVRRHARDASTR